MTEICGLAGQDFAVYRPLTTAIAFTNAAILTSDSGPSRGPSMAVSSAAFGVLSRSGRRRMVDLVLNRCTAGSGDYPGC